MSATIAVVDDEQNVRKTLSHALEAADYAVRTFVTGEEALESREFAAADLVLLDLALPGIDGLEVLRRMRGQGLEVPVVIITAYGTIEGAVEAMKLGAVDYLTKPFSPQSLREVVAAGLRRRALRDVEPPAPETEVEAALPEAKGKLAASLLDHAKARIEGRRFEEARKLLLRVLSLEASLPEAFNLLGVLHEMTGERDEARKRYRAALALDPHYEPAQRNLHRVSDFQYRQEGIDLGGEEP